MTGCLVPALPSGATLLDETCPRFLTRPFLYLCGGLVVMWMIPGAWMVLGLGAALYALRGAKESVEALTILTILIMVNRDVADVDISVLRWVILFAALGRCLWDTIILDAPLPGVLRWVYLFLASVFVLSVLTSQYPLVSALKLVTFGAGVTTIITGLYRTVHLRSYWTSWFITLGLFIVLTSIPFYALSAGYYRGPGFRGILNHSQTLGPVAAVFAAMFTGQALFEKRRSAIMMAGMAASWLMVYSSLSRTAFFAAVLGLAVTFCAGVLQNSWRPVLAGLFDNLVFLTGLVLVIAGIVLFWSIVEARVGGFLLKDDSPESVMESLQSSRGGLVDRSMDNFRDHPVTGIGFGVPSDASFARIETGFMGLPTGASVEKGFMPSAVLEEIGIIGAFLVLSMISAFIWPVLARGSPAMLWVLSTCLLLNLGEMVFFALGGNGLFVWLIMGLCYTGTFVPELEPFHRSRKRNPIRPY